MNLLLGSRRSLAGARFLSAQATDPFAKLHIQPVKRPDSAAYFTRKPKFYDLLSAISNLARQHPLPRFNPANYKRGKWIPRAELQTKLGISISPREHELLVRRLGDASNLRISDPAERETVDLYLNQFRRGYVHAETVAKDETGATRVVDQKNKQKAAEEEGKKKKKNNGRRGFQDHLGRWHAFGRRKQAMAFAWVVPVERPTEPLPVEAGAPPAVEPSVASVAGSSGAESSAAAPSVDPAATKAGGGVHPELPVDLELDPDVPKPLEPEPEPEPEPKPIKIIDNVPASAHLPLGDVLVNGKPLAEYFFHGTDRDSVLFPFQVANKVGHYNVFLKVSGGGRTGQAEACQLAVARALYMSDRKAHIPVREAGLLRTDGRAVERKKTGKPKARKSYTWVKR
ncbi:37S ribosomal protein S9, mitochondrial [Coemansia sp. BCRC 34962]|nr:37S ribosomal protein S9, mitochondrial [Coemansia sp. BCRC 34962]